MGYYKLTAIQPHLIPLCHSGLEIKDLPIPLCLLQTGDYMKDGNIEPIIKLIAKRLSSEIPRINYASLARKIKKFESTYAEKLIKEDTKDFKEDIITWECNNLDCLVLNDIQKEIILDLLFSNFNLNGGSKVDKQKYQTKYGISSKDIINNLLYLKKYSYISIGDKKLQYFESVNEGSKNMNEYISYADISLIAKGMRIAFQLKDLSAKGVLNFELKKDENIAPYPDDARNSLISLERSISNIENSCYYKECHLTVDCYITNDYIHKIIKKNMEVFNPNEAEEKYHIPFSVEMVKLEGLDKSEVFNVNEFTVDSNSFTEMVKENVHFIESEKDSVIKADYKFDISLCKGPCNIYMETETRVPLSDKQFTNKLTMPCRNYSIKFFLHSDEYKLIGYSFGYSDAYEEKEIKTYYNNGIEIKFSDWLLPGNGVIFLIDKL